jgi:hypothetical protein
MPDGTMTIAKSRLPNRLYRFRTFGGSVVTSSDKSSVFEMLHGRIRFARLRDFNDPFEGRPFALPAFADVAKQRAAVLKYIFDIHRSIGESPREARTKAAAFVAGKTQAEIVEWVGERLLETNNRDGLYVCCVSGPEALATPLAWSHYADHHRGIAVHFDTRWPPVKFAFPVIYSEHYPETVVPRSHQDRWEHVQRSFFTSRAIWYRQISMG